MVVIMRGVARPFFVQVGWIAERLRWTNTDARGADHELGLASYRDAIYRIDELG